MTREENLRALVTLNEALRRRGATPLFELEEAELLDDRQVATAVAMTRQDLVDVVGTLREA